MRYRDLEYLARPSVDRDCDIKDEWAHTKANDLSKSSDVSIEFNSITGRAERVRFDREYVLVNVLENCTQVHILENMNLSTCT